MTAIEAGQKGTPEYIARKNRELSTLVEMNQEIHSTMRIQRLLQILVEKAVVGLDFERGLIYLVENDYLRCVAFLDSVKKDKASLITKAVGFRMEETAVEVLVAKLGKSIYVDNALLDVRMSQKLLRVTNIKQYCAVPLIGRDRVLGVFTGDKFYSGKPILPEDIETLELFAGHISLAIENANLYEEKENFSRLLEEKVEERTGALAEANQKLSTKMDELSALFDLSQLLSKSLEMDQVMAEVLNTIYCLVQRDCAAYLLDPKEPRLLVRRGKRTERGQLEGSPMAEDVLDILKKNEDPFLVTDPRQAFLPRFHARYCAPHDVRSCYLIPLYANQVLIAAIMIFSHEDSPGMPHNRAFSTSFARQAGAALERALIFKELMDQKQIIEMRSQKLEQENIYLKDKIKTNFKPELIVGDSPAMKSTIEAVYQVSPTDATVIIYGETGTGKELVAKAIHSLSQRKEHPMITVNCAAIPDDLLESELFGHEKGAFTGAHRKRIGMFELADKGTIFLDEIGELSQKTQTKILRVLQEQEVQPIGSAGSVKVNVRIIAATNRRLEEELAKGAFRADLYYRLNVFPIRLPPLRERAEDIPRLAEHFIKKFSGETGQTVRLDPGVLSRFHEYPWPGNIRELQKHHRAADHHLPPGRDNPGGSASRHPQLARAGPAHHALARCGAPAQARTHHRGLESQRRQEGRGGQASGHRAPQSLPPAKKHLQRLSPGSRPGAGRHKKAPGFAPGLFIRTAWRLGGL